MELYFKMFSGQFAGAQIALSVDREFLVGDDYSADICIGIDGKNPELAKFMIKDNAILFSMLNGKTLGSVIRDSVGNDLEINKPYTFPFFFELNQLQVGVGALEDLQFWGRAEHHLNDDTIVSDELVDTGLMQFDDSTSNVAIIEKNKYFKLFNDIIWSKAKALWGCWVEFYKKNKIYAYGAVFLLLLLIVGGAISFKIIGQERKINAIQTKEQDILTVINRLYQNLPRQYSNLTITRNANGVFILAGLVANKNDFDYILNYFSAYEQKYIKINLLVISEAVANINGILIENNLSNLVARYDRINQRIAISGVMDGLARLDDIEIEINNKFSQVGDVDTSQVYDLSQVTTDFNKNIVSNFANILTINSEFMRESVEITGYLSQDDLLKLNSYIAEFLQKYPQFKIHTDIKDISQALPFKIYAIYTGNPSFIVTDTGYKIFVGGSFKAFRLVSIGAGRVVFLGKFPIILPFEQIANSSATFVPGKNDNKPQTTREKIIYNELSTESADLETEESQLDYLNNMRGSVKDQKFSGFINQQIDNLQQDIELKKHEIANYVRKS